MKSQQKVLCALFVLSLCTAGVFAEGVVTPGTTELNDSGTSGDPADWYLGDHYTIGSTFYVGKSTASLDDRNWNQLSLDSGYDFTATAGMVIGQGYGGYNSDYNSITVNDDSLLSCSGGNLVIGGANAQRNHLTVLSGGEANIQGNIVVGGGSVSYYGQYNHVDVIGSNAKVYVTDSFDANNYSMGRGKNCYLHISDGGVIFIDSDKDGTGFLDLYYNEYYGACYLELAEGVVAIWGNKTASYAAGQDVLNCIKLWDEDTSTWKIVTELPVGSSLQLGVEYVDDATKAAELGLDSEYIGFTVLQNVPEPASMVLLLAGGGILLRKRIWNRVK